MGFLGVIGRTASTLPALLPLALTLFGLALWAYRRKRFVWATGAGVFGLGACILYVVSPAGGLPRGDPASLAATVDAGTRSAPASRSPAPGTKATVAPPLLDPGRFSSTRRLHPRVPEDFPIPRSFHLESNTGGTRSGNVTVRFRFSGEAANAVCDLREEGRAKGWSVEILAPHRMTFRKDDRVVEAWFSYPAHSVVLDIPDNR